MKTGRPSLVIAALFCGFSVFGETVVIESRESHWSRDGIHPHYAGHGLLAREWLKTVSAIRQASLVPGIFLENTHDSPSPVRLACVGDSITAGSSLEPS